MKENTVSALRSELSASEERFVLWRERYQQHLRLMEQFYQWQERYNSKLAQVEEKRRMLQGIREYLMWVRQLRTHRQSSR